MEQALQLQQLQQLYAKIKQCQCDCPGERQGAGTVRDTGNPQVGILLLGEAPGAAEIKRGVPFVGQAGVNLDGYLQLAGLTRDRVLITNTVKCRPTKNQGRANRRPTACEIKACARWLDEELHILSPPVLITLGDVALKRVGGPALGLAEHHGRPLTMQGMTVIPMYHPAAVIYRRQLEPVLAADFTALGKLL